MIDNKPEYLNIKLSDTYEYQVIHRNYTISYKPSKVQAFINNIAFPKTLDELFYFATEHGCFNVENVLNDEITTWTVPRWAKIGDIVFFMHSKTARSTITKLRTELNNQKDCISSREYNLLMNWINRGMELYSLYGGKIFAIGRVCGAPEYYPNDPDDEFFHWGSRVFADIQLDVLDNPIDISEFNSFIYVSRQSGITGVFGKEYQQLRNLIKSRNQIPYYYENSEASPLPLSKINPENWMKLTSEYRRSFMLESQFRSYYVDYLLQQLGDQKTIFRECMCVKPDTPNSYVDNVILFYGKYLPVEVKLSVLQEHNINQQLQKYCFDDYIVLQKKNKHIIKPDSIHTGFVLVIDTDYIYLFNAKTNQLNSIFDLNDLTEKSDIRKAKSIIRQLLDF